MNHKKLYKYFVNIRYMYSNYFHINIYILNNPLLNLMALHNIPNHHIGYNVYASILIYIKYI